MANQFTQFNYARFVDFGKEIIHFSNPDFDAFRRVFPLDAF